MTELFEKLAAIEHERWADWQKYMHAQCIGHDTESVLLPRISYDHWERQIATVYVDLSEKEKESDRDQVRRYWPLIEVLLAEVEQLTDDASSWHTKYLRESLESERLSAESRSRDALIIAAREYLDSDPCIRTTKYIIEALKEVDLVSTQQDQFTIRKYIADKTFTMAPGETLDEFYARGVKSGYLREVTDSASTRQRTGKGLCPYCDHRIANIELIREDDGELHCNHCRGSRP